MTRANPDAPELGGLGRILTGQPIEGWREDMIDSMVRDGTVDGLKEARDAFEAEIEEHKDDDPYVYLLNSRIDIMTEAIDRIGDNEVTLYRCTECGNVESHELDTHIMRSHRPGGAYRLTDEEDVESIEDMQERIEIPVSELRAYAVEGED